MKLATLVINTKKKTVNLSSQATSKMEEKWGNACKSENN